MGKQGQDRTSHCFCPQQAPEGGSYQPGITKNAITMTTSHQPLDRYWGTWAVNPGEWKWVSRRRGAVSFGIWGCHR